MLYSDISGLTAKEIVKKKKELQAEMFDARMKNTLGQLPNQMVIRAARKDIARLNTQMTILAKKIAARKPIGEAIAEIASDVANLAKAKVKSVTKSAPGKGKAQKKVSK